MSAEEFKRLRESSKPEDYNRASMEEASIETWNQIINLYPYLAEWVAHNKKVPEEILERLHSHLDPKVRAIVAGKRKVTHRLLESLMADSDESVRMAVARNPKTPRYILSKMLSDTWDEIGKIAAERLKD